MYLIKSVLKNIGSRHTQTMFSLKEKVARLALSSRLYILLLQCVSNALLPDHDAHVFISPLNPDVQVGFGDSIVNFLLGGLIRWDAQYFLHVAKYGYTYENCLAFFPALPIAAHTLATTVFSPFTLFFTEHSLIIISFTIINVFCFVKTSQVIFDLSLLVLKDEEMAYKSAVLFCLNPASIFFSAPYSETLFALCSFYGMLCNEQNKVKSSAISFGLACGTRSNGILNIGFTVYKTFHDFIQEISFKNIWLILIIPAQLIAALLPLLISVVVSLLPFILFQIFSFGKFCIDDRLVVPKFITDHAVANNYKLAGMSPSVWCNSSLPLAYSYVQSFYWNVGFLKYYELKQVPNFLLSFPVIYLVLNISYKFIAQYPWHVLSFGLFQSKSPQKQEKFVKLLPPSALPYIIHAAALLIFCILCVHIQVTTRMIASSSPVLYWAAAYLSQPYAKVEKQSKSSTANLVETRTNLQSNWRVYLFSQDSSHFNSNFVRYYFVSYIIVGTVLFSNFFPWT